MAKRGNGEGTIFYSEKLNRWVGQFTAGRKDNGKLNRKSVYGSTRKEVKEKMTKALADVQSNTFIEKNDITLKDLSLKMIEEQFESNLMSEASYLRKIYNYKALEKLPIANMKIQMLTISNINSSLALLKDYSDSIISKVYGLISATLDKAVLLNIIPSNIFNLKGAVVKPKSKKQTKIVDALTVDEQNLFMKQLNANNYKYKEIFIIALYTGMRIGEILALAKSDINMEKKTININKTLTKSKDDKIIVGNTTKTYAGLREIPFSDTLIPILNSLFLTNENYLFLVNNKFIAPSTINSHFKKICKDAGIKIIITQKKTNRLDKNGNNIYVNLKTSEVNTHMLRHTFATRCIESGMSAIVLQKYLGHKDIETTLNTYTSVFNKFQQKELDKFESYMNALH